MINDWREFFDQIAESYENEVFTRNTLAEVDFIVEELSLRTGAEIIDIGCGTGRHSIELARRGYSVTGVDQSPGMLSVARKNAEQAGVSIDFVHASAQDYVSLKKADAVISICEGALCLFNENDDLWSKDMAILANMAESLAPAGRFLVTVLNAFSLVRRADRQMVNDGIIDLFTLTSRMVNECGPEENRIKIRGIERYYTPPEFVRMANRIGLKVDHVYGGTAGNWRRDMIALDEIEFMVVGHKKNR